MLAKLRWVDVCFASRGGWFHATVPSRSVSRLSMEVSPGKVDRAPNWSRVCLIITVDVMERSLLSTSSCRVHDVLTFASAICWATRTSSAGRIELYIHMYRYDTIYWYDINPQLVAMGRSGLSPQTKPAFTTIPQKAHLTRTFRAHGRGWGCRMEWHMEQNLLRCKNYLNKNKKEETCGSCEPRNPQTFQKGLHEHKLTSV